MLKNILAAIGVGGAKVETVLESAEVPVGGMLAGTVRMSGGNVPQQVNDVHLEIITQAEREVNDSKVRQPVVISRWSAGRAIALKPGENLDLPFRVEVPLHTPVYLRGADIRVWLRTRLEIPGAVDPTDDDPIYALPVPEMAAVVEAMQQLGFRLYKSDVEHRRFAPGYMQEFEFRPAARGSRFDEVEIVFQPAERGFDLLVQVDRAARGLLGSWAEAAGFDETWHRVHVPYGSNAGAIAPAIRQVLR